MPEDVATRPDDLTSALRALASAFSAGRTPIDCRFPAALEVTLPRGIIAACYRICEEALDNAVRHANARRIALEMHAREDRLVVRVLDDGVGFDHVALNGHGLQRMDEIARNANGRLDVRSAPHAGTCVSMIFTAQS